MKLSKYEIQDIIERLHQGEKIPDDYKYKLFPVEQKEYELVYAGKMRKEDILANEDGVFPVPLQIEKVFNGKREAWDDGWRNIISFGDNLQFLKTINENADPIIKDKIKGKVKLIYIDPPFATSADFKTISGDMAYRDKKTGSDFVEFLRKRFILAREILSNDGSIFVHCDWRKNSHIRIILDEVFGENNFRGDICWKRSPFGGSSKARSTKYPVNHDTIFFYSKSENYCFKNQYQPYSEKYKKRFKNPDNDPKGPYRITLLKTYSQERFDQWEKEGKLIPPKSKNAYWSYKQYLYESKGVQVDDVWTDLNLDNPMSNTRTGYPTQKPEKLLQRIIESTTNKGDIVLDFFAGSGTTASVAEKTNRKWITCDIGKLSFYTIQKRILNIKDSKSLFEESNYEKLAKSFITVNTGQYNLDSVFNLEHKEYIGFVMNLFEIEPIKKKISGINIDGQRKDGNYAFIWPYWEFQDASIDEEYLHNLHSNIGKKIGRRIYIVAPASYVDFISDYYEIENVRYYFLKVPYHIIKELHKVQFKKFRQPQSKKNVNDLEDAIGFHFMKQPEVKTEITSSKETVEIVIKEFRSDFSEDETGKELGNLESLAMVLIDKNFDDNAFDMDECYFAEDLLAKKKAKKDDEDIAEELKKINEIKLPIIERTDCGDSIMIIYIDVYGNEFKERIELK